MDDLSMSMFVRKDALASAIRSRRTSRIEHVARKMSGATTKEAWEEMCFMEQKHWMLLAEVAVSAYEETDNRSLDGLTDRR